MIDSLILFISRFYIKPVPATKPKPTKNDNPLNDGLFDNDDDIFSFSAQKARLIILFRICKKNL